MFIGWALAIVPVFHPGKNVIVPIVLGIIGMAIYGWAFWTYQHPPAASSHPGRARGA